MNYRLHCLRTPQDFALPRLRDNTTVTPADCWVTTTGINNRGYGTVYDPRLKRVLMAHRAAYMQAYGPIPKGLQIDHLCRNKACCNPAHLEAVTPQENNMRAMTLSAVNACKTHCSHGHPLSGANLRVRMVKTASRQALQPRRTCLACEAIRHARYCVDRRLKNAQAHG